MIRNDRPKRICFRQLMHLCHVQMNGIAQKLHGACVQKLGTETVPLHSSGHDRVATGIKDRVSCRSRVLLFQLRVTEKDNALRSSCAKWSDRPFEIYPLILEPAAVFIQPSQFPQKMMIPEIRDVKLCLPE